MNSDYIKALNQVASRSNLKIRSLSMLPINSTYEVTGIQKYTTLRRSRVKLDLDNAFSVYMPHRLNKLFYSNNRFFKSLKDDISNKNGIMIQYLGGKANEIKFFKKNNGNVINFIDEQKKSANIKKDHNNPSVGSSRIVNMVHNGLQSVPHENRKRKSLPQKLALTNGGFGWDYPSGNIFSRNHNVKNMDTTTDNILSSALQNLRKYLNEDYYTTA